jgi:hypothetical protein
LDLSKAFDTVNHSILIRKLEFYGIRGIAKNWFVSYLNNRFQLVTIENISSELEHILCGVPQGSVLGPLLFLYINDFNNCAPDLDFHLFADDANLFFSESNLQRLEAKLNHELENINEWLCANKLSLNVEKSDFVLFHTPQKKINYSIDLKINNTSIVQKSNIKYLGIIIDSHLN